MQKVMVFDLDGTLIDTAGDLVDTLNWVLEGEFRDPIPRAKARNMVGFGAAGMLTRAYEADGLEIEEAELKRLTEVFVDHYRQRIAHLSRPFPGVVESLDKFLAAGWKLAICTNKREELAVQLMDELRLTNRFAVIRGGDSYPFRKPDPRHIIETVRAAGGDPEVSFMVGDSAADTEAAQAADIPVVAVTFGYCDGHVRDLRPDGMIDHFIDLFDLVASLERRRDRQRQLAG